MRKTAQEEMGSPAPAPTLQHDLDATRELLQQHSEHGYAGLKYKSEADGAGGKTITIHFPSPSEQAKYDAMAQKQVAPQEVGQEPMPAVAKSGPQVVVKVAMSEDEIRKQLGNKYPREFLSSLGLRII